jgi:hypothetical protein
MATSSSDFKIFKTLNIAITDILKDTVSYLTTKFKQSLKVFTAASPFGQIIIVIENLSQLIFYYIEDSITELSMIDATRVSSIYSLSQIAGHNPSRAISAGGEVSFSTNSNSLEADFDIVLIPNLTKLKCVNNGLNYVIKMPQDNIKFSMKGVDNGVKLNIQQGIIENQTFVARGISTESITVSSPQNFFVDNYLVDVFVNGEKWKRYDSILDMPKNEKAYMVKTGVTSGVDIYFGNDYFGKIPKRGSQINVEYLINGGASGNIQTLTASQVKFEWEETGFTLIGNEVDLNEYISVTTTQSPNFGADPEDSELTRLLAPKQSKSFALVNIDHYEAILYRLKLFSMINVFLDENDNRMLNLFLIPDVSKLFNTGQDYFTIDPSKFKFNNYQKNELLRYLDKTGSKLISTDVKIIDPEIIKYVLNISIVAFNDVATEVIKRDIIDDVGNYFVSNKRRSRVPKSDIIRVVEDINGVDSVSVAIVGEENETAHILDPNYKGSLGLDEFNDIIGTKYQLPIVQGGFKDRYGNEYNEGISDETLGALNIQIKKIIPRPLVLEDDKK